MKINSIIAGFIVLWMSGCATAPQQGAAQIIISNSLEQVKGCKFIGQASVGASSMPIDITRESAITNMRNRAIEMGGTHVVSAGPQVTMPGPAATMTGDIYRCA